MEGVLVVGSRRVSARLFAALATAVLVFQAGYLSPPPVGAADPSGGSKAGPVPPEPGWSQDPDLVAAKNEGRVIVDASGKATVLATAPLAALAAPVAKVLDTTVIKKIWEPKGSGAKDNNGKAYTDRNYWNLCAPGGVAVALYYWPESRSMVAGIAGDSYTEPNSAYKTYYPAGQRAASWGSGTRRRSGGGPTA